MTSPITESQAGLIDQVPVAGDARKRRRSQNGEGRDDGNGGRVLNVFSHGFLVLWAVMIIFPLLWIILSSFKNNSEIGGSAWSWPSHWGFGAFSRAWEKGIGDFFLNTVIVMIFSVPLTMLFGSMVAYVLARYEFRGNRFFYYLFVTGAMFPYFLALVPLFFMVRNLHMLNTYQGLILVYVAYSLPFTTFFMHSFFKTLPTAVHEAAVLDGASHTRTFFQIMVPMAKPGLLSVGIFNVLGQWNQYILPVTLMQPQSSTDKDHSMLAQGLVNLALSQGYSGDYPALFAGMVISMLPVLVVYLSFQRQVQAGLTAATLK
jgi:N-acetylglucosamine transport system permease protein